MVFYSAKDKSAPRPMHVWFVTGNYWPVMCTTAYWPSVWTEIIFAADGFERISKYSGLKLEFVAAM